MSRGEVRAAARTAALWLAGVALVVLVGSAIASDVARSVARVKASVFAIGTYERTRSPAFEFRGTAFAVGDGTLIITNAHVLPGVLDGGRRETIAILGPAPDRDGQAQGQVREARRIAVDENTDLALLKIDGAPMPALVLGDSDTVREGQEILLTGYPIGALLGPYPATHHGIVAAITPIAIAQPRAAELDSHTLRRLAAGPLTVFQLDATAYPGNSGSPVWDPQTNEVLGVLNMVFVKGTKEAALSQPSGIAYAIPSNHVRHLLDQWR